MGIELKIDRTFDEKNYRHIAFGRSFVSHCNHHAALYTQLAEDASESFGGHQLLVDAAEESFYKLLKDYFSLHLITGLSDRAQIAEKFWSYMGMGKLIISDFSETNGTAEMPVSHIDSGWEKKFGKRDKPVNYITHGYLAAVFAVIRDLPIGSYSVQETQSIVIGNEKSKFTIEKK